jgi:hypothetical protein
MLQDRTVAALLALLGLAAIASLAQVRLAEAQVATTQTAPDTAPAGDTTQPKQTNSGIIINESITAGKMFEQAGMSEERKDWESAAGLYQKLLEGFADQMLPVETDKGGITVRYTSIAHAVRQRLCHWPREGLDVYCRTNEPKAAALLEDARKSAAAGQDDSAVLDEVVRLYFVTDSGKAAALGLIDEKLDHGDYFGAALLGDELLNLHPNLTAERPAVLFDTALASRQAGDAKASDARAAALASKFPNDAGVVRGKVLAQALAKPPAAGFSPDSWPMPGGNARRDAVPDAHVHPGLRMASIPLAKPDYNGLTPFQKTMLLQQTGASAESGETLGVMPSVDRGELFFQDGMRVYAVSLESGAPLPGWVRTWGTGRQGQYVLPHVWGSTRSHQQTITLTDHQVLAVMGQPDNLSRVSVKGEARLVCLDRETGKENWVVAPPDMKGVPKDDDEGALRALELSGSPLVVGNSVLVIGRTLKQPGEPGEDCYVLAFDLSNGQYRWGRYVAGIRIYSTGDRTSHLAYADGRVYVLSNLGAVAALDARDGTIVWLDTYPTGELPMNQQFLNVAGGLGSHFKPWMTNPVVVHDGKLFVLPAEGDNLLICDAASGREEKRISLDQLARWDLKGAEQPDKPSTLIGVMGERLVLAGESRVLCLDWQKYDETKFPGPNDEMILWPSVAPFGIRGRCFMTTDTVFVPGADHLRWIDMKTGAVVEEYPRYPRTWEDGESPGNVVVSGDHLIVAGASSVDVYTELAVATAKLDRDIAAAPNAPGPHLRYAEVMSTAGRPDEALSQLNEALKLMGGAAPPGASDDRDRLFSDALKFAAGGVGNHWPGDHERVVRFFDLADRAAYTPQQKVNYRMARVKLEKADPRAVVRLYQGILADPQMRAVPIPDAENDPAPLRSAADVAESAIDDLVRTNGPEVYAPYQWAAEHELEATLKLKQNPDQLAGKMLSIAEAYPNSSAARQAMLAAAVAYESAGSPRQAIRVLRQMWFNYALQGTTPLAIAEAMARNYLAVTDRPRADMLAAAAGQLARAASLPGDPKLSQNMKLPDGRVLPAGTPFAKARDEVRGIHAEPNQPLPDLRLPVPPTAAEKLARARIPAPFLGQDPKHRQIIPADAATVLPGVTALLAPERDFARVDQVVAWGAGTVAIFAAGQTTPLFTVKAFPDAGHGNAGAPRGVAWVGDTALVWGPSRLISIDASPGGNGKILWDMDLTRLGTLQVVRPNDAGGQPIGGAVETNGVNVDINPMIIRRNGPRQQTVINGGGDGVVQGGAVPAPGLSQPAVATDAAPAVEQVAEVRPVGERVLVCTNAGRLLSAEIGTGRVAWQTRLTERALNRLVATEDFTVVKVSDDITCRLIAMDTYSGRVLGVKSFSAIAPEIGFASVPVNLALSADGTLVFTMPDRIWSKDLYKPWNDEEQVVVAPTRQAIYAGANLPGQLVNAGMRVLAVTDNAPGATLPNQKWVSVYSLETGERVALKYETTDSSHRIVDVVMTADTKDWNVLLRVVGPHVYVVGPNSVFAYNLDKPNETWKGSMAAANDGPMSEISLRQAFCSRQHLVVLDQPVSAATAANGDPTVVRLLAYSRRLARENDPNSESGRLDYPVTLTDPAGIQPASWQACDGGFYYATDDGKVHMLRGAKDGN